MNLYLAFVIHFIVDVSNGWRKLINDSLCVILNNYSKSQTQSDQTKDHSRESMDAVYGTKYIGTVISWIFFLIVYSHVNQYYFYFLSFICLLSVAVSYTIKQEPEYFHRKVDFKKDLYLCIEAIRKNKLLKLVSTSAFTRSAPSFIYFFDFYLKNQLNFNTKDFTFKYLLKDLLFYCSLFLMNRVFKNLSKSFYLRFILCLYFIVVTFLIFIIDEGPQNVFQQFTVGVLIVYQSMQLVLFNIYPYPLMAVLWEVCPLELEGFFMGLFNFMNEFFIYLGTLMGTIIIQANHIESNDYKKVCLLVLSHCIFILVGLCILFGI